MTQEEKQILFIDLCGRLPYRIKVHSDGIPHEQTLIGFIPDIEHYNIKPYLRPMSSMTEDEKETYECFIIAITEDELGAWELTNWLNAHHFDYRGLIEKGLAIEAPEDMYKN